MQNDPDNLLKTMLGVAPMFDNLAVQVETMVECFNASFQAKDNAAAMDTEPFNAMRRQLPEITAAAAAVRRLGDSLDVMDRLYKQILGVD